VVGASGLSLLLVLKRKGFEKLMLCFARGLGFPDGYFVKAHEKVAIL
jgi:hypothetical protein